MSLYYIVENHQQFVKWNSYVTIYYLSPEPALPLPSLLRDLTLHTCTATATSHTRSASDLSPFFLENKML